MKQIPKSSLAITIALLTVTLTACNGSGKGLDEDDRSRSSLVWEYTPMPLLQVRTGFRLSRGIPQNDQQNTSEAFLQMHGFF